MDRFLTAPRLQNCPLIVLFVMLPLALAGVLGGHPPLNAGGDPIAGDFAPPLMAARILSSGNAHRLYDLHEQFAVEQQVLGGHYSADPFISPPLGAYLYVPFAWLPYMVSVALWTVITLSLFVGSLKLLWPLLPNLHRFRFSRVVLVALSTRFAFELVLTGQDSAISLLLFVLGLRLLLARRDYLAGSVLALGLMKPQLVIVFPFAFLAQRRWKALGAWLVVAAVLTAVSVAILGLSGVESYIRLLTSDVYENSIALPLSYRMLSVLALARSVTPVGAPWLVPVMSGFILVPLTIGFARLVTRRVAGVADFSLLYSLTVVFTVLISPHFFVYDGVLLLLPALVLADRGTRRTEVRLVLALTYLLGWGLGWAHLRVGAAHWPMSLLAAPWLVVGIVVLYRLVYSELAGAVGDGKMSGQPDRAVPAAGVNSGLAGWNGRANPAR